ncbi:MAG TPA: hypothetical protein VLT36_22175 [Candidatus Dormibacteraeota bacterium]|nr:hypothetical protein [Candidatus Dormibacteraeota bacterium]
MLGADGQSIVRKKVARRILSAMVAPLVCAGILVLFWRRTDSPTGSGAVSVTFLNYTNSLAGSNAVGFVISNSCPKTVTIANYFFMCPNDQTWDVANPRRMVLGSGNSARLMLAKAKGDCTLLVLYSKYDWREAVRNRTARLHLWRWFPRSKWGLPAKYERAMIQVPDPVKSPLSPVPK